MHTASIALRVFSAAVLLVPFVAMLQACGGGSPRTPTGPNPQAAIQVTGSPSPIALVTCPPERCGAGSAEFELITTLTLRESGGVGGRVNTITVTLRRNNDNVAIVNTTVSPASVQVPFTANGTATIPFEMHAPQAAVTAQTTLALVVNATDANGRAVTASLNVAVGGPPTASGLFITGNYTISQTALTNTCGDSGTPATVTGWVSLTGGDTFQLRDTGGTSFTGTVQPSGRFTANAVFGPDAAGQTFTQQLDGEFVSGGGFTGLLTVTVQPRNCTFTRGWIGTRLQ